MLIRPTKKKNILNNTHRATFSDIQHILHLDQDEKRQPDWVNLKKAKKVLQNTQQLLLNRIKALRKEEDKIVKKRETQLKLFLKLQSAKKQFNLIKSLNKTPRKLSTKEHSIAFKQNYQLGPKNNNFLFQKSLHQQVEREHEGFKAQKLFLQKIQNVRRMKEEKLRNQAKITHRCTAQMNRKLKSAGLVKRNRQKVKETRCNFFRSRQESIQNLKHDQYQKEKENFVNIQRSVKALQRQEELAFQKWRRTFKEDSLFQFQNLQIKQAKGYD